MLKEVQTDCIFFLQISQPWLDALLVLWVQWGPRFQESDHSRLVPTRYNLCDWHLMIFSYNFRSIQRSRGREVLDTWATSWLQQALPVVRYPAIPWPGCVNNWVTRLCQSCRGIVAAEWCHRDFKVTLGELYLPDTAHRPPVNAVLRWTRLYYWPRMATCEPLSYIIWGASPNRDFMPGLPGAMVWWAIGFLPELRRARCQLKTNRTWWSHMRCLGLADLCSDTV